MRKWNLLSLGFSQIEVKGFQKNWETSPLALVVVRQVLQPVTLVLAANLCSVFCGGTKTKWRKSFHLWPQTGGTMLPPGTRTGGNWLGRSMATVIVGGFMNSFVAEWGQSRATAEGGGIMAPGVFLLNPHKSDNLNKHYLLHNAKKGKLGEKC